MNLPYRFGRYVLLKKIAQGGMAEIFKAQYLGESGFSKEVCIKRLLPVWSDNPDFVKMLIDEAKALVQLSHPNIVQVFELGRDGKSFFISMELIDGIDLQQLFQQASQREEPIPLSFILYIIACVLKGLRFAHRSLVHRDISPQNILLSFEGEVKVTDFGIAKGAHRSLETTQHQIKGKYSYMSPEQAKGGAVDPRTDLYAVGILLYELLEGKKLFEGKNDLAVLELVREGRLPHQALMAWPTPLRAVVLKALQKEAADRYPDAEAFLEDMKKFVQQEGLETSAEEFACYLNRFFTKEEEPLFSFPETIAPEHSRPKNRWRAALLGLSSVLCWQQPLAISQGPQQTRPAAAVQKKIPALGSVTIAAKPNPVNGILKIAGREKEFTTPFHWGELDISKAQEGVIVLELENGKTVEEKFVLSKADPHWLKTFVFEEERPGILRVAARPWGEVTVPGVVTAQETPLAGLRLKAGSYRLQVRYPPSNLSVEKEIRLTAGSQRVCQADFNSTPSLNCR